MIKKIQRYNSIKKEEIKAGIKVLKSGNLSGFFGTQGKNFLGGKEVKKFEAQISKFFKIKYAVTFNSWTSGLIASLGAINIEPGDEVICTPWTMTASASAILHWNAIPVFVDIEPKYYGLNLDLLKKKINKKTKAIVLVDIFGQSENIFQVKKIAKKYKIKIISDSAHAPSAKINNKFVGTLADVGGFSLNYHKHINTGEGGIAVTNNIKIAKKLRLIRNHGEAVVSNNSNKKDLANVIGHNFRLGEIEAAIGFQQLKKLKSIAKFRTNLAKRLMYNLRNLPGLNLPQIRKNSSHVFYIFPMSIKKGFKIDRKKLVKNLKKKGFPGLMEGYQNLHLLPIYQKKIAYGTKKYPWKDYNAKINYKKGICPVAEHLHDKSFFAILLCSYDFSLKDIDNLSKVFKKEWQKILS
jgi:perosamine synthetase